MSFNFSYGGMHYSLFCLDKSIQHRNTEITEIDKKTDKIEFHLDLML